MINITGNFQAGATPANAVQYLNRQGSNVILDIQKQITAKVRAISVQIQNDINAAIDKGPTPFTKRAVFFNYIQNSNGTRSNQIIIRGAQAKYLRDILEPVSTSQTKIVPFSDAKLTQQGNISGLKAGISNGKYKIINRNGKKYLIDTTKKKKNRDTRIVGMKETKQRRMVYDFFQQAEQKAIIALRTINGTYTFRRI